MTLITYKPRTSIISDFDRLFNNFWDTSSQFSLKENFNLNCRINENEDCYFIETDLPGVEKKDIDINITDDTIVISGERKVLRDNSNALRYGHSHYGEFTKSFYIPDDANRDKINAKMKNGVLEIEIKKSKNVSSSIKKIAIK